MTVDAHGSSDEHAATLTLFGPRMPPTPPQTARHAAGRVTVYW